MLIISRCFPPPPPPPFHPVDTIVTTYLKRKNKTSQTPHLFALQSVPNVSSCSVFAKENVLDLESTASDNCFRPRACAGFVFRLRLFRFVLRKLIYFGIQDYCSKSSLYYRIRVVFVVFFCSLILDILRMNCPGSAPSWQVVQTGGYPALS